MNKILLSIFFSHVIAASIAGDKTNIHTVDQAREVSQEDSSVVFLRSFFKWYKTRFEYLDHKIHFIDADFKSNGPYKLNPKEVEKYLSILTASGFFSDDYLKERKAYFDKIGRTLKKTKQNDGPVDGLDFDLMLYDQEPESTLKNLSKIKLERIKTTSNEYVIKMTPPFASNNTYSMFHLVKKGDKYQINQIRFF